MLVLTRRTNQSIMIGNEIEVTVVEIRGDQVRLGITAPKGLAVDRKEIRIAKDKEAKDKEASVQEDMSGKYPVPHKDRHR